MKVFVFSEFSLHEAARASSAHAFTRDSCTRIWFAIVILLFFPSLCLAQYTTGMVHGSVLDPSGALVKDASVELKSLETGEGRTFPTTADGLYSFTAVPPGRYRLRVTATGFASHPPISLFPPAKPPHRTSRCRSDKRPPPSTVQADAAPLLDASDPLRGVTYNETEVGTLPNLNRNINSLVILGRGPRQPSIHAEGSLPPSMARRPARSTPMADAPSPPPRSSTTRTPTIGSSAA